MSYRTVNSHDADSINQSSYNNENESYVWLNLIHRGVYQFSVVAATSNGSGLPANVMYDTKRSKLIFTYVAM